MAIPPPAITALPDGSITRGKTTRRGRRTKTLGIGDEAAGVRFIALGILAALHARERTGEGQKVEVSMQEAVLGFMTSSMHGAFHRGDRVGNRPDESCRRLFRLARAGDGLMPFGAQAGQSDRWRSDLLTRSHGLRRRAARRERRGRAREELVKTWASGKTRRGDLGRAARAWIISAHRCCPSAR